MSTDYQKAIEDLQTELSPMENQLKGGNKNSYITRSKNEFIGGEMNTLVAHRIDPVGKTSPSGVLVQQSGLSPDERAVPHLEYVAVPDLAGGDYNHGG